MHGHMNVRKNKIFSYTFLAFHMIIHSPVTYNIIGYEADIVLCKTALLYRPSHARQQMSSSVT